MDLLKSVFQVSKQYWRRVTLKGITDINGIDIRHLVESEIQNSRGSGEFLFNFHFYYCAKRLSQTMPVFRCFYPFENRPWEKMLIMGLKSVSPLIRIVGYQHSSLTLGHTNLILIEEESEVVPLPDAVLTTGDVTKDWLESAGNFPDGIFNTGCALRQSNRTEPLIKKKSKKIKNVLLVLATSLQEYVNSLLLIESAFSDRTDLNVQIRPHPSLWRLASATDIIAMEEPWFFSENIGPLEQALEWADVVLYSSSTVGIEALFLGIPVVYVDLGGFVDTDPLFGWKEFKWHAETSAELGEVIRDIDNLSEESFIRLQQLARDYASSYLKPITQRAMDAFWNC